MTAYAYVIWSKRLQKRYIGSCRNLENRIIEHNRGKQRFTKGGIPWELIYQEEYSSYPLARKREIFLKTGQGREYLDNLLGE